MVTEEEVCTEEEEEEEEGQLPEEDLDLQVCEHFVLQQQPQSGFI